MISGYCFELVFFFGLIFRVVFMPFVFILSINWNFLLYFVILLNFNFGRPCVISLAGFVVLLLHTCFSVVVV